MKLLQKCKNSEKKKKNQLQGRKEKRKISYLKAKILIRILFRGEKKNLQKKCRIKKKGIKFLDTKWERNILFCKLYL